MLYALVGFADEDVLQRHGEGFGCFGGFPGFGPACFEESCWFAGVDAGADGVAGVCGEECSLHGSGVEAGGVFAGGEPAGSGPGSAGAERECGGDLGSGADAAGGEDGGAVADGSDDFGDEDHGGDFAGVPAGLVALGDDDVDAFVEVAAGVFGFACEGGDVDVVFVGASDDVGWG